MTLEKVEEIQETATRPNYTLSDGCLNLLCWFTIYPNKFFATFFRQLCLFGCGVSKSFNSNGVQTVYCCPECYEDNKDNVILWDMDREAQDYWICCDLPGNDDMNVFLTNFCGHCLDHVHYVSKYNSNILSGLTCLLWLSTLLLIKIPGIIIYIIGSIIYYLVIILLIVVAIIIAIILSPLIPLIFVIFLSIIFYQNVYRNNG